MSAGRTFSRATRPSPPAAQQARSTVQSSVWKPSSLNCFQLRPPLRLTLLPAVSPDSPTTTRVPGHTDTHEASSPRWARSPPPVHVRPCRVYADASTPSVGSSKSPPTATPCQGARKARPKTPADSPAGMVESDAVHVRPRSVEWKTLDALPPEPNHAWRPRITRQSPLAEKLYSPVESGIPSDGRTFHDLPPSSVEAIWNVPSTGSLTARPRRPPG